MFQAPEYTQAVSARLSEVLADIGVDERIVMKRRRTWLLKESMDNISGHNLLDKNGSRYTLGSQSEGTTTFGVHSDIDQLVCSDDINMIQDWSHWQPGVINYLMIQDETVSPGYCLLQRLRADVPLSYNGEPNKYEFRDRAGRILLRNKIMSDVAKAVGKKFTCWKGVQHGPAHTPPRQHGVYDTDIVGAFLCKSWPLQARQWLNQQGVGQWPSDNMRRYCSRTGCFVVGVGNKRNDNEQLEWRISTSLAERCLMFNLNITQIRCYVLMKMILKTYIKPQYEDTISSFMCKTVLFKLIANTHYNFWRENNVLVCLSMCLFALYNCILNGNCPHFMIPGNNLIVGHINHESKPHLLEILLYIIHSEGTALFWIESDDLGSRLLLKLNNLSPFKISDIVSGGLLQVTAENIDNKIKYCLSFISHVTKWLYEYC
ncbi:cyclic GMP-AMP synthase-like [Mercenaria mercenaria]|uniref:cyclic GMP-AMP synthase-like n=1 Tax=Mercenaria mercenaria TaxID=6596 RepID=UPI00234E9C6A|nr:cyclic GMP-AMP synthase-like [Mercenaria mercenaria]